jgi:uncharacterized protein with beta-barrel porin domain
MHGRWLYDWVGDKQSMTSNFAGGGAAFNTEGFTPAQSAWNFGSKLTLMTQKDVSLELDYDLLFKEDYYEHYGSLNVRYSF